MALEAQIATGIAGSLGLDVKLFLAQLLNFGIVVAVLWRWVYRPLLKAMDERTRKIEQGLADAERSAALRAETDGYREETVLAARQQAQAILEEAQAVAATARAETATQARAEAERIVAAAQERLAAEKTQLVAETTAELADVVVLAVGRLAGAKLDPKKDAKLIKDSLKGL